MVFLLSGSNPSNSDLFGSVSDFTIKKIRPGYDLITYNSITFTSFMYFRTVEWHCVQMCKVSFWLVFYGTGKQQPEEGGREAEVAWGFRWNWKGKQEQMLLFMYIYRPVAVLMVHIWTAAYWWSGLQMWWQSPQSEIKKLRLKRRFGVETIACVKLCGQAERQILTSTSFLNICAWWVPGRDAELQLLGDTCCCPQHGKPGKPPLQGRHPEPRQRRLLERNSCVCLGNLPPENHLPG